MPTIVRHQQVYRTLFASPGVQMILSSYCVLAQWDHDDLTAPYWRWYWNDAEGAVIHARGEEIAVRPDRIVLVPPGTAFATQTRRAVGHLYLHFVTGLRLRPEHCRPIVCTPAVWQRRMILRLRQHLMSPTLDSARHAADYLAHALVTSLLADFDGSLWATDAVDSDMSRVLAVMHENAASIDVRSLPASVGISPNTLLRRFRRATGTTPGKYLMRLRIDNVALDLRATDDSIESIARRRGFCDRFHLSKAFKQTIGVAPAAYRAARQSVD